MKKTRILAACLFLGPILGVHAGTNGDVKMAIQEAKAAYKKADSIQGAWTNTPKLIKKAEKAATTGDKAKALEFAMKAKKEAELAYKQAIYERENWSPPPYAQ